METGTPNSINWLAAADAISAPAVKASGPRVPTSVPTPINETDRTYTFAKANGTTCR
jgi:hypothetical protein